MATLILTAVGTAIGGPIGGAIGALAGQALDARLLRTKGREGPRLTDLAVQTSRYGAPIPLVFGTLRVAGTIIWSTDLIEHVATSGGGKNRGSTTQYSYSASFAVLLSARPIRSVGRIWADGKLLRGAAGDFKASTHFRLYCGDETQAPDPLIASAEGGLAPASRGYAYAVFEDLALADFGNRIPSLTFEVFADEGAVSCGVIAATVARAGIAVEDAGVAVTGYAAYGDTVRAAIEGLLAVSGAWLASSGERLALRSGEGPVIGVEDAGVGEGAVRQRAVAAADTAAQTVLLQHHDPARDYQVGVQRVSRTGAGRRVSTIDLPAAVDAENARAIAAAVLHREDVERERRTVSVDWRAIAIAQGARVMIAGEAGQWRVVERALEKMAVSLDLVRIARRPASSEASSGRIVAAADRPIGATILQAFEIPPLDDNLPSAPRITIAAAGTGAGWRSAALQASFDGGLSWTAVGGTRGRATLGWLTTAPERAPSTLVDRRSVIEVTLADAAMTLGDADAAMLDAGANLAIVGDELVQFGHAERIGPARWRLGELWRGRRGTEWAIGGAVPGDRFVLLDAATLTVVDVPQRMIGGVVRVLATGVGDGDDPVLATVTVGGDSVTPPSPVHLTAETVGNGTTRLTWVRRSRSGWTWRDDADVAIGEEAERYDVTIERVGAPPERHLTPVPEATTEATAGMRIAVRQVGTLGTSRAASIIIP